MLIVSNGAFKSGSSWLFRIVKLLTDYPSPPEAYLNPAVSHPSIAEERLAEFLERIDLAHNNYLSKNHLKHAHQRDLLLSNPDVVVVGVQRDLRDVVVSAYYHYKWREPYEGTFYEFYWTRGRQIADRVRRYNLVWAAPAANLYVARYESLLNDFAGEMRRICAVLSVPYEEETIQRINKATDFTTWKARSGSKHLRKGTAGDWRNHFDRAMTGDIQQIEDDGLPPLTASERSRIRLGRIGRACFRKVTRGRPRSEDRDATHA